MVVPRIPGCPSRHEPARSQQGFRITADNFHNHDELVVRVCSVISWEVAGMARSRSGLSFSRRYGPGLASARVFARRQLGIGSLVGGWACKFCELGSGWSRERLRFGAHCSCGACSSTRLTAAALRRSLSQGFGFCRYHCFCFSGLAVGHQVLGRPSFHGHGWTRSSDCPSQREPARSQGFPNPCRQPSQ